MPVFGDAPYKADDTRQDFDPQLFYKERHVFYKDAQEPRIEVLWGEGLNCLIRGTSQVVIGKIIQPDAYP